MRDFMAWALPLGRWFGIQVRVHLLFILLAIGLIGRTVMDKLAPEGAWLAVISFISLGFLAVLLHEFGHCWGAWWVDGEAHEVLIWPLGGLAYVDVPPTPRDNAITVAAGPAVNLLLAVGAAIVLLLCAYVPPLNPLDGGYGFKMYQFSERAWYGSRFGPVYTKEGANGQLEYLRADQVVGLDQRLVFKDGNTIKTDVAVTEQPQKMSWPIYLLGQFFWINWGLFWLNIALVGFPLDGGRLLQCWLWARSGDQRAATQSAVTAGFITAVVLVFVALLFNEVMIVTLAAFIGITCVQQKIALEVGVEDTTLGYDFSQGYTSLERGEPKVAPPRKPNFLQRWWQRREARKAQKAQEQREAEDRRMDELLDKIHRQGNGALTDEERRFMNRVSQRFKKRDS
jgi:Zn-dependent protease